jgi:hypothetical protein
MELFGQLLISDGLVRNWPATQMVRSIGFRGVVLVDSKFRWLLTARTSNAS